jgi:hypothetical protein
VKQSTVHVQPDCFLFRSLQAQNGGKTGSFSTGAEALNSNVELPNSEFELPKYKVELLRYKFELPKYKAELLKYKFDVLDFRADHFQKYLLVILSVF